MNIQDKEVLLYCNNLSKDDIDYYRDFICDTTEYQCELVDMNTSSSIIKNTAVLGIVIFITKNDDFYFIEKVRNLNENVAIIVVTGDEWLADNRLQIYNVDTVIYIKYFSETFPTRFRNTIYRVERFNNIVENLKRTSIRFDNWMSQIMEDEPLVYEQ
jgi:hypothetical protein